MLEEHERRSNPGVDARGNGEKTRTRHVRWVVVRHDDVEQLGASIDGRRCVYILKPNLLTRTDALSLLNK